MFKRFLLAFLFSFFLIGSVHVTSAATTSLIPTENYGTGTLPKDCIELGNVLSKEPHPGEWLAMKIQCGRMGLGDVLYYVRYMLGFIFNILGTLGLLGIIRAGYKYIMNKGKDNKEGQLAIKNAVYGIVLAFSSFTIARVIFSFLQTT